MAGYRQTKVRELLRTHAAEFLAREAGRTQSLITVTDATISPNEAYATIYITVFPVHKEAAALDFANRQAADLRGFLKERTRLRRLPRIEFAIDIGEKNRQRIDELSRQ